MKRKGMGVDGQKNGGTKRKARKKMGEKKQIQIGKSTEWAQAKGSKDKRQMDKSQAASSKKKGKGIDRHNGQDEQWGPRGKTNSVTP